MAFEVLQGIIPAAAAGVDFTLELGVVPVTFAQGVWTPTRTSITSPALLTGATATQLVFTFQNRRGSAATLIGTIGTITTTTGTNLPAGVEVLVAAGAITTVQAGDVIEVVLTHASTGTAYGALSCRMELQ